jgi:hypothetical protein
VPAAVTHVRATAIALVTVLLAGLTSPSARAVQRCESAQGTVTYSDAPCPPGTRTVRQIDAAPVPVPSDQKAARERATRESKALQEAQARRRAEEAEAQRARANALKLAQKKQGECRQLEQRATAARDDLARVPLNRREQAERKVRAAQDRYDLACKND